MENETAAGTAQAKKARTAKTRTIGICVTESEYVALQLEAYEHNQTVSEWGRIKVIGSSAAYDHDVLSKHIFTELVDLQLLLMNTLPVLPRGDHMMPAEQVVTIKNQVQATKRRRGQELLAKRAEEPEKWF